MKIKITLKHFILTSFIFSVFGLVFSQTQTVNFVYTGAVQTWIVPACVYNVTITAAGAKGGGSNGGNGAVITGIVAVTPGQTLNIYCGGMGIQGNNSGGWNGGGTGWASTNGNTSYSSWGGGGASDVRIGGTALANRVIVGGAGGGRSGGSSPVCGGASTCNNGAAGCNTYGQGGQGGSQFAGGAGGTPWAGTPPGGSPGSLGNGGNAGVWQTASGGGGGGGRYGGGGGGNDGCCTGANGGGGGGAGSSLLPAGGTCLAANNTGNGYVNITYTGGGSLITVANTGPYCAGQTINLTAANGASSYSWAGPNGFSSTLQNPTIPNSTAANAGLYTLSFTTPNCNGTSTTTVVVNTPIVPTFNSINPICQNGAVPGLLTSSTNSPPITGTWSPSIISSNVAGIQTYTFTPAPSFCATTATLNVTILPNETPTFNVINPLCINDAPPLLQNPSTNATPYTGTWSPPNVVTSAVGTFTYNFTPTAGQCAVPTTFDITILNYTNPTFQQIGPLCQYTTGVTLPGSSTNLIPITGTWVPNNINTQIPNTTVYNFTPDPFQCSATGQMTIVIDPLNIPQFAQIPPICQGDVPPLIPTVSNNIPGISGTWSPPTIDSSIDGVFTHTFTPDPNQCADSVIMDIVIIAAMPPSFVADTLTGCNPLLVNLSTQQVQSASYTWVWNNNTIGTGNSLDYLFTSAGCHDITLIYNLQGCIETTTYNSYICMENYPVASFTSNPNVLSSQSEIIQFNNNTLGAVTYFWDFGDGETSTEFESSHPYVGVTENMLVSLTGTTPLGCSDTYELTLVVISDPIFYVPNSFTPDQDENNQTWHPVFTTGFDPYKFSLSIYNRWGEVIWESLNSEGEWDGTYGSNGIDVPIGIYTWIINYANKETDDKKVITGTINLIR